MASKKTIMMADLLVDSPAVLPAALGLQGTFPGDAIDAKLLAWVMALTANSDKYVPRDIPGSRQRAR